VTTQPTCGGGHPSHHVAAIEIMTISPLLCFYSFNSVSFYKLINFVWFDVKTYETKKGDRVEKEEKVVVILLLMAVLSLTVAYITIYPNTINEKKYQPLSEETEVGEISTIEGVVYEKALTRTGEHLILTMDYNSWLIKVFVPGNTGAEEINNLVIEGDRLRITGKLDEYKGEKELIVENKNDVILIPPA